MRVSVLDIFKIGIGPSSSHTVGPMKAALSFIHQMKEKGVLQKGKVHSVNTELFGSLAQTGKGHGTDTAVLLGLQGFAPDTVDTQKVSDYIARIEKEKLLNLNGELEVPFSKANILWKKNSRLAFHPNALRFTALDSNDTLLLHDTYYSIGGGFILSDAESKVKKAATSSEKFPLHFETGKDLLTICHEKKMTIPEVMRVNELSLRSENELNYALDRIIAAMRECIKNGLENTGILPGGLNVKRRAKELFKTIEETKGSPFYFNSFLSAIALAVNEENAAGGRVVTAPTNGAAGIIPAVLAYYEKFFSEKHPNMERDFLLTAAAIGILFKKGATFSGAEGGCQAEVGTACAMAAGGLTQILGGSALQVENAAEIGIEHNLGLTCDPVEGLVQVPCIERNAVASVKAVTAAMLSLAGNGKHLVSLDTAIRTMKTIGDDMKTKYKETSTGGLAKSYKEDVLEYSKKEVKALKEHKLEKENEYTHTVIMPEC